MKKFIFTDADFHAACWEVLKEYLQAHPGCTELATIVEAIETSVDNSCKGKKGAVDHYES